MSSTRHPLFRVFLKLGRHLQSADDRVALVLAEEDDGSRHPASGFAHGIPRADSLTVRVRGHGASNEELEMNLDLPRRQIVVPGTDAGEIALASLVGGLDQVTDDDGSLPRGYDEGVFVALREAGSVFGHEVETIEFRLHGKTGRTNNPQNFYKVDDLEIITEHVGVAGP